MGDKGKKSESKNEGRGKREIFFNSNVQESLPVSKAGEKERLETMGWGE